MIDLSTLTAPEIIEPLDYETILSAMKAELIAIAPVLTYTLELESDPIVRLLEIAAYRELNLRARINDAAKGVMLAYAVNSNLDVLAANFGVERLAGETDTRLRLRAQLAIEGKTNAGTIGAYTFHALSASALVLDVSIESPTPGLVRVNILAAENNGVADSELIGIVDATLNAENVRPLCDTVDVVACEILEYAIDAEIEIEPGPSPAVVIAAAQEAVQIYVTEQFRLDKEIALSGIYAALHQSGVRAVTLNLPAANIICTQRQAARCTAVTIAQV